MHVAEKVLRRCISLLCRLRHHPHHLRILATIISIPDPTPWLIIALTVPAIKHHPPPRRLLPHLLRPRRQIHAARRAHLLDVVRPQLLHARDVVDVRARHFGAWLLGERVLTDRAYVSFFFVVLRCCCAAP